MSAKLWIKVGGTKPVFTNGMKFGAMKSLPRLKRATRRHERFTLKRSIGQPEHGDPREIGREFSGVVMHKATVSERGVTAYTNLTTYDGRLYLE